MPTEGTVIMMRNPDVNWPSELLNLALIIMTGSLKRALLGGEELYLQSQLTKTHADTFLTRESTLMSLKFQSNRRSI